MTKFLHTADLHLGRAFKSIGAGGTPELAAELEATRYQAVERLGELAAETGAAFVVVAGDLFDTPRPSGKVLAKALQAFGKVEVPVYAIPGNHDPGGPLGPYATAEYREYRELYAPHFHLLTEPAPVVLDEHRVALLPCPIVGRPNQDPTTWLRSASAYADLPEGYARVCIAHGGTLTFASDVPAAEMIHLQRLERDELDYVALGDWHGTLHVTDPIYRYAGTPEPDRFPRSDTYRSGLILEVAVARGAETAITEHQAGRFAWLEHARTLRSAEDVARLDEELLAAVEERGRLLRLVLDGSLDIAASAALSRTRRRLSDVYASVSVDDAGLFVKPGAEELDALRHDRSHPAVASVARKLAALLDDPDEAPAARLALVKLYEATRAQAA